MQTLIVLHRHSVIWTQVFIQEHSTTSSKRDTDQNNATPSHGEESPPEPLPNLATRFFPHFNFLRPSFPSISSLLRQLSSPSPSGSNTPQPRQQSSLTPAILASYATIGPFIGRLVAAGMLTAPQFTVTLQRDAVDLGGNVGQLSIGELPGDVQNGSLTWARVRGYTSAQGGLGPPADSPNEVCISQNRPDTCIDILWEGLPDYVGDTDRRRIF